MSKGGGRLSRLFPKLFRSDKDKTTDRELKGPVCMVLFLDDTEQRVSFKTNWKGQVLFDQVCDQVNIFEKDYFGLRFVDGTGQTHWVDHGKSLSSQIKSCSTPHKFYFCVKFYAADPCKLKEEITRYLFFLQVKRDILQGRLPVTFEEAAELCAYAVQSELGDFDPRINTPGYVSEFSFVPNQTEELENRIAAMHRRCVGATPLMAEHRFLEKSKWLEMYGVDLHPVQGESNVEYFLGLTPTGIVVYKHKTKVASYFWPRVTKASHKSKIFMIKVKDKNNDEHVYAFELSSKSACKHLWKCCVEHHTFFRLSQAKDKETRPTKVLRSLSNSSHRGRSERQAALGEHIGRQEPSVYRVASRRQQRRVNSESRLNAEQLYGNSEGGLITLMGQPQPVRAPRHRSLPELQGKESPRSVKSAPWESKYDYGLYTSGHESPGEHAHHSRRSRAVSGSDSESGISQRKKYFPSRKESDNESDGSASRRRRREMDSDSGSEVSFTNSGHGKRHNIGTLKDHNRNDLPILYPFHDKDKHKNGSIPSLHSAPVGEFKQQRRRRRRSKSPGNSKQFPEELKQHIEFNLIDTEGMTEDQMQDIAYTKVETKSNLFRVKYSPKFRQKIWASRRKSFGDADKPEHSSKGGSILERQDSRNTDPAGAYGGYTTHGGSSMDERPPPYNSVRTSSGNPVGDNSINSSGDYVLQSGYESCGSHISSSSRQHHHPHYNQNQPHHPPSPYHVTTSSTKKQQNKENNNESDSDTLVSYAPSIKSQTSRGVRSDVIRRRRKTSEREGQFIPQSVTDSRHHPNSDHKDQGLNRNSHIEVDSRNRHSRFGASPNQVENNSRFLIDQQRKRMEQDSSERFGLPSESYAPPNHYPHQNRRHLPPKTNHYHPSRHTESLPHHRFSVPLSHPLSPSSNTFLPPFDARILDASSSAYGLSPPKSTDNIHYVTATHPNYHSNPRSLPDSSRSTETARNSRLSNKDYNFLNNGRNDSRNRQQTLPQHNNSSNPHYSYQNPVYFNNNNDNNKKGVSTNSKHFSGTTTNNYNGYNSGNPSGSESNYNSDFRGGNKGYSQNQRQSTVSSKSTRTNEYGRQTPSRNLYQEFKDSTIPNSPGESASSPSRSVGVTANTSQMNTPPRSHPPSYHQNYHQHHPHSTPSRSDYGPPNSLQQQQHTPPRAQQTSIQGQGNSPPRMQQQQTPPRSQYSIQSQLRGGSSVRGQGSQSMSAHERHQPSSRYNPTTPQYNSNTNPPDNGHHMRGHSGQSASSSGYSGSHSYQSTLGTPGIPSGTSPHQSRPGNLNIPYNSQQSKNNSMYNQRQSANSDVMGQGQRLPQGPPPSQAYTSTPRRGYRSDLVTEL